MFKWQYFLSKEIFIMATSSRGAVSFTLAESAKRELIAADKGANP